MSPLTEEQANSFIEKIGEVFDVAVFTKTDANRLLSLAKESVKWEMRVKQQLTKAGLTNSIDQIAMLPCNPATNNSILPLQILAPLFALHNLESRKENVTDLIGKIIASSGTTKPAMSNDCVNYTAPFPRDFYTLDEVRRLRPEYFIGTWFNRQEKPFKINMELDWVNRMWGTRCMLPAYPMDIALFASTGDHIWDFISEVHIHRTAMKEFSQPRDGWIEAPGTADGMWKRETADPPLKFIDRMMNVKGRRTILQLHGGTGGWATFESVRNSEVTAAAARLLFKFSDPLYCARADGKVVIKWKASAERATLVDKTLFPTGRSLVNGVNNFPLCIE